VKEYRDSYRPPRRRPGERIFALALLLVAAGLPAILWRDLLATVAGNFNLDAGYILTGASGFLLMGFGLLAALPVVLSIGRNPEGRLYPRSRGTLAGWSVSLYLLGVVLVVQIAALAHSW
jgi:hypothetical protein